MSKGQDRLSRLLTQRRRRASPLEPLHGRTGVVVTADGSGVTVDLDGVTAGPFSKSVGGTPSPGDTVFLIKKGDHYLVIAMEP